MQVIKIHVDYEPAGMPRPSHRALMGKDGKPIRSRKSNRVIIQSYTSKRTDPLTGKQSEHPGVTFKKRVAEAVAPYFKIPHDGPISISWTAFMHRPQYLMKKSSPRECLPYFTRVPDRDNVDKAVMDALQGLAYTNDWQVYRGVLEMLFVQLDHDPECIRDRAGLRLVMVLEDRPGWAPKPTTKKPKKDKKDFTFYDDAGKWWRVRLGSGAYWLHYLHADRRNWITAKPLEAHEVELHYKLATSQKPIKCPYRGDA